MNDNPFSKPILTKTVKDTVLNSSDSLFSDPILKKPINFQVFENKDSLFSEPIITTSKQVDVPAMPTQKRDLGYSKSIWFIGVLLLMLMIFSKIRLSYSKLTSDIFSGFFRYKYIVKIYESKNTRNNVGYLLMNLLFLTSIPLFLFQLSVFKGYFDIPGYKLFLIIVAAVMALFAARIVVIRFIGLVFNGTKEANEYIFNLLMHFKVAGIIIFPLTICIPYIFSYAVPTLAGIGLLVIGMAYLLSVFRGIKILYQKHVSLFYMILYLCALEIVPALILLKITEIM